MEFDLSGATSHHWISGLIAGVRYIVSVYSKQGIYKSQTLSTIFIPGKFFKNITVAEIAFSRA